jgi:hypothetical protein
MANLAGFFDEYMLGLEPDADDAVVLMALPGRANGTGESVPRLGVETIDEGCCRMAKTKVLFTARRWHCG